MLSDPSSSPQGSCLHRKRAKTEDVIVCSSCGIVLENDALVEGTIETGEERGKLWAELSYTQRVSLEDNFSRANKVLHDLVRSICARYNLPNTIVDQTLPLIDKIISDKLANRGRAGRKAAAALVYLLCRNLDRQVPIFVNDLANLIGEAPFELFSTIALVKPTIISTVGSNNLFKFDPTIYLERQLEILMECFTFDSKEIIKVAKEICQFAEDYSLVEGRKPESISFASILIAAESWGVFDFKSRHKVAKLKKKFQQIKLGWDTVITRIKEIKDALLIEARRNPLINQDLEIDDKDSISKLLPSILRHHSFTESFKNSSAPPPPAFVKSTDRTRNRLDQLDRAKERLKNLSGQSESELQNLNIEDLIIERLSLHGVPDHRIVEALTAQQLFALESEVFFEQTEGYLESDNDC